MLHPTVGLAFLAGLVSFLSPCVFPLVPVYAGYLGANAAGSTDTGPAQARLPVAANGVAFVIGFSAVFILLYYVFTALAVGVFVQHEHAFSVVAGVVIIIFALQLLGVLRLGWLMREARIQLPRHSGTFGSLLLGVSFAAGWSPCLGPQLGAILTLAHTGDFGGLPFMLLYCLGLAVPFLIVALAAEGMRHQLRALNRHLNTVSLVAGGLLLLFGILLVTGRITLLSQISPQSPFGL